MTYGSLQNMLLSRVATAEIEIGSPATIISWTDRHPATVIAKTPKSVTVQSDDYARTDNLGMSDCQSYDYTRNLNGSTQTFRLTKKGWRSPGGGSVAFGFREKYHDFSF